MKQAEVTPGRYVALINGNKTIVKCFTVKGSFRFRCESTNRFVSLTARRLWRVALDHETVDSATVQNYSFADQKDMLFDGKLWLPVIDDHGHGAESCDTGQSDVECIPYDVWSTLDDEADVAQWCHQQAITEGKRFFGLAGC